MTNTTAGALGLLCPALVPVATQLYGPEGESTFAIGLPLGVAVGPGLGLGLGLGLAVVTPPGTKLVWCRLKFVTTSTPTTTAAIKAAARPAIQIGPVGAGLLSVRAERTRADRAGLGCPLMSSKVRLMSRRKSSRLTSGNLLEGQVGPELSGGPVDTRFGR
ncbi:MAG TPA: hypothetical protein VLR46_09465, partial [Candidatus Dormibacteraeota bacterium]|nr:hypothetical protein [Candidatus Dormibacteraeota bacterium]